MARRVTVTLDPALERALREAPRRLGIPRSASVSERLREYVRRGYEAALDAERLETYRRWADARDIPEFAEATTRVAAKHGLFKDD
jgi:hypothetical protein